MTTSGVVPLSWHDTPVPGLLVITARQVTDDRGTVREFYRRSAWADAGLPNLGPFLQANVTESRRGVVRGLHGEAMTKLVGVAAGHACHPTVPPTVPPTVTAHATATETLTRPNLVRGRCGRGKGLRGTRWASVNVTVAVSARTS